MAYLVCAGVDASITNTDGQAPAYAAALSGHTGVLQVLLQVLQIVV